MDDVERETRRSLVDACRAGPVSLVLGAGISHSRGVPLWDDVVERVLEVVTGDRRERELLERVRALVARELDPAVARRLMLRAHPLEPQLTLEWVRHRLEDAQVRAAVGDTVAAAREAGDGDSAFAAMLRWALYSDVRDPGDGSDALAAVARVVCGEVGRGRDRRLVRIVTLNADDLLERETGGDGRARAALAPIVRASQHPPGGTPAPIPIYHLHGYLPRDPDDPLAAPDRLVFTDAQLWSTTANPLAFANRVIAHALHDSRCVFAGLSMRDVNLMRWLAVRYDEMLEDVGGRDDAADTRRSLDRHFWAHAAGDDPSGILTDVLARRGVHSIDVGGWDADGFGALLGECFGG